MRFEVIEAWALCASLGNKTCLVLDQDSLFVPLLGEDKFVSDWNDVGRFLNELPSPHSMELV